MTDSFAALLSSMGGSKGKEMLKNLMEQVSTIEESDEVEILKNKIVSIVLGKIGVDSRQLESLCKKKKTGSILSAVASLTSAKAHDFLIVSTYPDGNYGYLIYKGTYEGAKKEALHILGREYGVMDVLPKEETYLQRRYPIYTLATDKIRVEVVPHGSHISLD